MTVGSVCPDPECRRRLVAYCPATECANCPPTWVNWLRCPGCRSKFDTVTRLIYDVQWRIAPWRWA